MSAQDNLSPQQFFHGSGKRFKPGDVIDPSQSHKRVHPQISDKDKVYFSDSHWNAQNWANVASSSGKGHVYEVEPIGDYEPDPHYSGKDEGIYDLSQEPMRRVNVYQSSNPIRVKRRLSLG